MTIDRLITMVVSLLLCSGTAMAQFDPSSPPEPDPAPVYSRVVLLRNIAEAGSVSGAGTYLVGSSVRVYAYTNSSYKFEKWTNTQGDVLALSSQFNFRNTEATDTLIAHYSFVPGSPSEPSEPSTTLYYRLGLQGQQGCSVSGSGRYQAGTSVYVYASVETGYTFQGWVNSKGELVSGSTGFYYTVPVDGDTLTARCVFNPSAPQEPDDPVLKHTFSTVASDGGWCSCSSNGRYLEGSNLYLSVGINTGYEFEGWYLNGEFYTALRSFNYTMGKEDLHFYAKFKFNPASPSEPLMPAISMYSYYLMSTNGVPGETIPYAIYLVNTEVVKDMNIRLTFPEILSINPEDFVLSAKAQGYTVTIAEAQDTISIIEEGSKLYDFTLVGGETQPATQALLTFQATIPEDAEPGLSWPIKINQINMVMYDGTAVTARTRNGRLGVYEWGDANTDGEVDVADASLVSAHALGDKVELDSHIADIHTDGALDVIDYSDIVNKVLKSGQAATAPPRHVRKKKTIAL